MKKHELRKKLINNKIKQSDYSLEGGLPNEAYCLEKDKDIWRFYYSERGYKREVKEFKSEDEACDYFYNEIIKDLKNS